MTVLIVILMILSGIGAVFGVRAAKTGSAMGKSVAIACTLFVFVLAIVMLATSGPPSSKKFIDLSARYNYLCGEKMGRFLAENYAGKRVLVLQPPVPAETGDLVQDDKLAEGLRDGLENSMPRLDFQALEIPDAIKDSLQGRFKSNSQMPAEMAEHFLRVDIMNYQMWFDQQALEEYVDTRQDDYDVIVLAINLPVDYSQLKVLRGEGAPKLALLNANTHGLRRSLSQGAVIAAIATRNDPKSRKKYMDIPRKDEKAFQQRFLFLTPENISEMVNTYPDAFRR